MKSKINLSLLAGVAVLSSADAWHTSPPTSDNIVPSHAEVPEAPKCPFANLMRGDSGIPISNNKESLSAGPRGPTLVEDWRLFEKHGHFNRERLPERIVHAFGAGAYGTFTTTNDMSEYTIAKPLTQVNKTVRTFVRFSNVAGERGSANAVRDIRGFATKFYTDDGNWDLVGIQTPVFFIRDAYKFPDFIHTQKRDPHTHLINSTSKWDFWTLHPESFQEITHLMSRRGLPLNYRHMDGFSAHTFSLINAKLERTWIKFVWKNEQGLKGLSNKEAEEVRGNDWFSYQRDLYENIKAGNFPKYTLYIQTMSLEEAKKTSFDPFDMTKAWNETIYPLKKVGEMVLDTNVANYFDEVEQAAFSPSHVIPGISFSPDKMLQFRIVSYGDAQRYRLGINYELLLVNQPIVSPANYARDGRMRAYGNDGFKVNYEPNSFDGPVPCNVLAQEIPWPLDGEPAKRYDQGGDESIQVGELFRSFSKEWQDEVISNIAEDMKDVPLFIQARAIRLLAKADLSYAQGVAKLLAESNALDM